MPRIMDATLNVVSCRTVLIVVGIAAVASAVMTGLQAGKGGSWPWWLLLALLFAALWAYTWFYCGREAVTGRHELGQKREASAAGGSAHAATGAAARAKIPDHDVAETSGSTVGAVAPRTSGHWSKAETARSEAAPRKAGASDDAAEGSDTARFGSAVETGSATSGLMSAQPSVTSDAQSAPMTGGGKTAATAQDADKTPESDDNATASRTDDAPKQDEADVAENDSASGAVDRLGDETDTKDAAASAAETSTGRDADAAASDSLRSEAASGSAARTADDTASVAHSKRDEAASDDGKAAAEASSDKASNSTGAQSGTSSAKPDKDEAETPATSQSATASTTKPKTLDAPLGGKADDLKQIAGVGPKLESLLYSLGVYHFDQIAVWSDTDVAWVDDHLGFKGRIERDDWIGQSKTLARGETTEFADRVGRGEVDSSKKS